MTLLPVIVAALLLQASPAEPPAEQLAPLSDQGIYSFTERQEHLVQMATLLGRMHHLHQVCQAYDYLPERFRDRMKELVTLEEPMASTKARMVSGFNDGYQSARSSHATCTAQAEAAMRQLAAEGEQLTRKLAAPFRRDENYYDYYSAAEPRTSGD